MAAIATERIAILMRLAAKMASSKDTELADRYAGLARTLGMRYNIRLPADFKRRLCPSCGSYLVPGRNLRVRLRPGKAVWTCLKCKKTRRTRTASAL